MHELVRERVFSQRSLCESSTLLFRIALIVVENPLDVVYGEAVADSPIRTYIHEQFAIYSSSHHQ